MNTVTYRTHAPAALASLEAVDRELSRWLSGSARDAQTNLWRPRADIAETDDGFRIDLDLPGVDPASVDVTVEDGTLTVSGNRPERESDTRHTRLERPSGEFRRAFSLPDVADVEAIQASAAHGVLTLTIGKRAELAPRQIKVNVAESAAAAVEQDSDAS